MQNLDFKEFEFKKFVCAVDCDCYFLIFSYFQAKMPMQASRFSSSFAVTIHSAAATINICSLFFLRKTTRSICNYLYIVTKIRM